MKTDSAVVQKAIELQGTIITLQSAIMTIQSEYQVLQDEKESLKKQLAELENWEAEAAKYQLIEIPPGSFAYILKPEHKENDLNYWLCTSCYSKRQKSILQNMEKTPRGYKYSCPNCTNQFVTWQIPNKPSTTSETA